MTAHGQRHERSFPPYAPAMVDRQSSLNRYLDVWNGIAGVDDVDDLVTPGFVGHMGSRDRDVTQLKLDIGAYRARADNVRFEVMHRFSDGDHVATRLVVHAVDRDTGAQLTACGLNVSRWEDGLLAEEWAVWEALHDAT
jgi:hypothetical protein